MYDWVIGLIDQGAYGGVFLLMLLETLFPPIPSEVILPLAGMRAGQGALALPGVIAAATAGAMVGNLFWYWVARAVSRDRFLRFIDRYGRWLTLDRHDVDKAQAMFRRGASWIVCIGRFLPNLRTIISVPAGLARMKMAPFLLWSTLGTAVWSAGLAGGGYLLGARFERIDAVLAPVSTAVIVGGVLWYVWRQLTWSRRRLPDQSHPGEGRDP
jgi:membrane protein DedA with SNARE-associated domain